MAGSFLTNDLSAVFDTADFATSATWNATSIDGVFDEQDEIDELGQGSQIFTRSTFITLSSHGVADGDTIVINSTTYTVAYQLDDGTGVTTLTLEES